jgi:hypothetical protein
MVTEAAPPDHSRTIANKLGVLAGNERQRSDTGDPGHRHLLGHQGAHRQPVLEWRGPAAFARVYGRACGIDHNLDPCWGSNGDQLVSLRVESSSSSGLLYVYDPTWDEYAVIDPDIPLAAVLEAVARAQELSTHVAVEDFMALLPQAPTAHPSAGPEL